MLPVQRLKNRQLAKVAEDFLRLHHPEGTLPIPIEEIIDLKLGISIVSVPKLRDVHGVDAYTSSDFSSITIDDFCYQHRETRARYSLAHEVGHILLHKSYYEGLNINDWENYLNFQTAVVASENIEIQKNIENQAYILANMLLVPVNDLRQRVDGLATEYGGSIRNVPADVMAWFRNELCTEYCVSGEVVERAILREYRSELGAQSYF